MTQSSVDQYYSELLEFYEPKQVPDTGSTSENVEESNNATGPNNDPKVLSSTVFSVSYYQQFFNVNTEDVLRRIKGTLFPSFKADYYETLIRARADLYGPVWVCLTLAFSIAIGSNLLDYFTTRNEIEQWRYGFHVITKALLIVLVYSWIIPLLLWSMLRWYLSSQVNISALELICTYGYALVVYIPLSILWIVPVPYFQWLLLLLGATTSGLVLISTMQPVIGKEIYTIVAAIVLLHIFFSIVIFISFFHVNM